MSRSSEDATDPLAAAMGRLYGVPLEDFMATRKALVAEAKTAGDKGLATAVGKLRKPSLGAWAVNLVARQDRDAVQALLEVGARMRAAQSALDAATLTGLRGERDATVDRFVRSAVTQVASADRTLSAAGQDEVRATAIAALADAAAAEAVASGQLTKALSYSGFGEVDLSDAVVRTSSGAVLSVIQGGAGAKGRDGGPADPPPPEPDAPDEEPADVAEPEPDEPEPEEPESEEPESEEPETEESESEEPESGEEADDADDEAETELETDPEPELETGPTATDTPDPRLVEAAERALSRAEAALRTAERRLADARRKADLTRERVESLERQLATAKQADERAMDAVADAVQARRSAETDRSAAEAQLDTLRD